MGGTKRPPPPLPGVVRWHEVRKNMAKVPEIEIREDKGIYDGCVGPKEAVVQR